MILIDVTVRVHIILAESAFTRKKNGKKLIFTSFRPETRDRTITDWHPGFIKGQDS